MVFNDFKVGLNANFTKIKSRQAYRRYKIDYSGGVRLAHSDSVQPLPAGARDPTEMLFDDEKG